MSSGGPSRRDPCPGRQDDRCDPSLPEPARTVSRSLTDADVQYPVTSRSPRRRERGDVRARRSPGSSRRRAASATWRGRREGLGTRGQLPCALMRDEARPRRRARAAPHLVVHATVGVVRATFTPPGWNISEALPGLRSKQYQLGEPGRVIGEIGRSAWICTPIPARVATSVEAAPASMSPLVRPRTHQVPGRRGTEGAGSDPRSRHGPAHASSIPDVGRRLLGPRRRSRRRSTTRSARLCSEPPATAGTAPRRRRPPAARTGRAARS